MIVLVKAGGQTGVDQAAWRAAKALGIATGGVMPKGFLTHDGPRPHFAELYGAEEGATDSYRDRTDENVKAADFTLRIATHWNSPGERRTANAIVRHNKPRCSLTVQRQGGVFTISYALGSAPAVVAIRTLANQLGRGVIVNVAGNSERTSPGIGDFAQTVLTSIFGACT